MERSGPPRSELHASSRPIGALLLAAVIVAAITPARADDASERSARGDIAVIVHPSNKLQNISRSSLAMIFLRKTRTWPNGRRIMFFNGPAGTRTRVGFDRSVLEMSPEKSAAYWIDQRIRGQGTAPRALRSPALVQRIVAGRKVAIGYVPATMVKKGVKVLRVDGMAPGDKKYPIKIAPK